MSQESAADARGDYEIGRNRPPRYTRFKPGQSGNPKGRPKGSPNARSAVARAISEKIAVKDGQKTRRLSKFEALLQAQLVNAIKGDPRAANVVTTILGKVGLLGEQEEATRKVLSMNDTAILEDFLRRRTAPSNSDTDQPPDAVNPKPAEPAAAAASVLTPTAEMNSDTEQQS